MFTDGAERNISKATKRKEKKKKNRKISDFKKISVRQRRGV